MLEEFKRERDKKLGLPHWWSAFESWYAQLYFTPEPVTLRIDVYPSERRATWAKITTANRLERVRYENVLLNRALNKLRQIEGCDVAREITFLERDLAKEEP